MINRSSALQLLKDQHLEKTLLHHSLETEAVMSKLASSLGEDVELWAMTGLLHDLDFTTTANNISKHGIISAQLLEEHLPPHAIKAILCHNYINNGSPAPQTKFEFALRCGESITGLVAANALVRPNGMVGMKPKSLKKKMKAKAFAAAVDREIIMECEKLDMDLSKFLQIAIDAISEIATEVELNR
jgi:uncharacterized protein